MHGDEARESRGAGPGRICVTDVIPQLSYGMGCDWDRSVAVICRGVTILDPCMSQRNDTNRSTAVTRVK